MIPNITLEEAKGQKLLRFENGVDHSILVLVFENGYLTLEPTGYETDGVEPGTSFANEGIHGFSEERAEAAVRLGIMTQEEADAWGTDEYARWVEFRRDEEEKKERARIERASYPDSRPSCITAQHLPTISK